MYILNFYNFFKKTYESVKNPLVELARDGTIKEGKNKVD